MYLKRDGGMGRKGIVLVETEWESRVEPVRREDPPTETSGSTQHTKETTVTPTHARGKRNKGS